MGLNAATLLYDGAGRIRCSTSASPASQNVLNPLSAAGLLCLGGAGPSSLFAAGEQGVWYEPSLTDNSLFQDSAGTVPVTAVEQPVGRINDKSGKGNHATQATAGSRPTLSSLKNEVLNSEEIFGAGWAKTNASALSNVTLAPDGTLTADKLIANPSNTTHYTEPATTMPAASISDNAICSVSAYYKKAEYDYCNLGFIIKNGSGPTLRYRFSTKEITLASQGSGNTTIVFTAEDVGNGWVRLKMAGVLMGTGATNPRIRHWVIDDTGASTFAGDGSSGVYCWGAQVEWGSSVTSYQRVGASAAVYDAAAGPLYLKFDGTDDFLVTSAINFSTSDKLTAVVAQLKNSDAAFSLILGLTAAVTTTAGSLYISGPNAASPFNNYGGGMFGSANITANSGSGANPAPNAAVLTMQGDFAGTPQAKFRINGTQFTNSGAGVVAGFANAPVYIGRNGGTSSPFNGRIYSIVMRGTLMTAAQLADLEAYIQAELTGSPSPQGVGPEYVVGGVPYKANGSLSANIGGTIFNVQNGLPLDVNGNVVCDSSAAIAFSNCGLPFTAAGKLAIAAPE